MALLFLQSTYPEKKISIYKVENCAYYQPRSSEQTNKFSQDKKVCDSWAPLYWLSKGSKRDRFEVFSWEKNTKKKRKNSKPVSRHYHIILLWISLILAWSKAGFLIFWLIIALWTHLAPLSFRRTVKWSSLKGRQAENTTATVKSSQWLSYSLSLVTSQILVYL